MICQFKEHFHMASNTFYLLENKLSPMLIKFNNSGRPRIEPKVQLLAIVVASNF